MENHHCEVAVQDQIIMPVMLVDTRRYKNLKISKIVLYRVEHIIALSNCIGQKYKLNAV